MAGKGHPLHARVNARLRAGVSSFADGLRRRWRMRHLEEDLERLSRSGAEVLVLPHFLGFGGIRRHIEAIVEHSGMRAELVPGGHFHEVYGRHELESWLSAELARRMPATVMAVHSHVFPWAIRWCRGARERGIRWVHTYHALYTEDYANGGMPGWQHEFNAAQLEEARHADVCVTVSGWLRDQLERDHGIKAVHVPNGVDVGRCVEADGGRFRAAWGIEGDYVLFVGRDDPVKHPAEFARLAAEVPGRLFVMVGRGLDAAYLAREWGVEAAGNLKFVPELPHREVMDAVAGCAALVVTSRREGLPTLVLEGMAMGRPVVAPREPGCAEALGDGAYGWLYGPGDIGDLAGRLEEALGGGGRLDAARRRVSEFYDWQVVAHRLDQIYRGE